MHPIYHMYGVSYGRMLYSVSINRQKVAHSELKCEFVPAVLIFKSALCMSRVQRVMIYHLRPQGGDWSDLSPVSATCPLPPSFQPGSISYAFTLHCLMSVYLPLKSILHCITMHCVMTQQKLCDCNLKDPSVR